MLKSKFAVHHAVITAVLKQIGIVILIAGSNYIIINRGCQLAYEAIFDLMLSQSEYRS